MFTPPQVSCLTKLIDFERCRTAGVRDWGNAAVTSTGGAISDDTLVAKEVEFIDTVAADLFGLGIRVAGGVESHPGGCWGSPEILQSFMTPRYSNFHGQSSCK